MSRWSAIAVITVMVFAASPDADAGKRPRHCKGDKQCSGQVCCSGTCCSGACNTIGECCPALSGSVACGGDCCDTIALGESCCNDSCVDPKTDSANCGGCGNVCGGGKTCQNGSCACPESQTDCDGRCVDTSSDHDNCGSCGNACSGGYVQCTNGSCGCVPGLTQCGQDCLDVTRDPNNCGSCGNTCPSGECANGACTQCSGFQTGCSFDEVCRDGVCVHVCGQPPAGSAVDGSFVACDDGNGGVYCGCNGCTRCGVNEACCSCGCRYGVFTTCADFCQSN